METTAKEEINMPIYERVCNECKHKDEFFETHIELEYDDACPRCGIREFKRVISVPSPPVLRGDGFYKPSKED